MTRVSALSRQRVAAISRAGWASRPPHQASRLVPPKTESQDLPEEGRENEGWGGTPTLAGRICALRASWLRRARGLVCLALVIAGSAVFAKDFPPTTKPVPPPGLAIPDADRAELTAGAAALRQTLDALTADRTLTAKIRYCIPDAEVFWKAVDWALRYDEFFDKKQPAIARELLKEGAARAQALREGKAPWMAAPGNVILGYRSEIDDSVQPYAMSVPSTWHEGDTRKRHLYVWNHGRGDTLTELAFISGAMKKVGEFTPDDTFVIAPYGRFCNATKFAGERDVREAVFREALSRYPIDPDHIIMTGFSMGGASVWHLATHFASEWAAATPGAGFCETAIYTSAFATGKTPPPWWEQQLWHLYNARDVVANLANTRLIAYSGEIDPQKQSADLMEEAAAKEGITLERLIGPNTAHKYEPKTREELARRLEESAAKGRDSQPKKVRLVTYTLAYPQQAWVTVFGLEKHWERAEVNAELVDAQAIRATTSNVSEVFFKLEPEARFTQVELDGQKVHLARSPLREGSFSKVNGHWQESPADGGGKQRLQKNLGVHGPIDDAFQRNFFFVRPTGKPLNETVGRWAQAEMERAIAQWRKVFRGDVRIIDDKAVTEETMKVGSLVLWGDPSSNSFLAKILPQLPLQWTAEKVTLGAESCPAANCVPILIYPNPLHPTSYVVLNSSFTFRQGSDTSNALQTPKLPDWALVDLRTPPSAEWPGLVVDAGFFNEEWKLP